MKKTALIFIWKRNSTCRHLCLWTNNTAGGSPVPVVIYKSILRVANRDVRVLALIFPYLKNRSQPGLSRTVLSAIPL